MRITCEIWEEDQYGDNGGWIPGVRARCSRCGHETEAFGTDEPSIKRCLVMLREECPEGESNFYVRDDDE